LKKSTKKRLLGGRALAERCLGPQKIEVFLLLFVHKKKVLVAGLIAPVAAGFVG
jgi:hypothetical protein